MANNHTLLTTFLGVLLAIVTSPVSAEPYETVEYNGSPSNRVDLVLMGDGYTASQMTQYRADVQNFLDYFFQEPPFDEYRKFFNVHRIDVISAQSGSDEPPNGIYKNTALDSYYYCGGVEQVICASPTKINGVISRTLSGTQNDMIILLVNHSRYGGASSGSNGFATTYARDNYYTPRVATHEIGHLFGNLADEYGGSNSCSSSEPPEANVTRQTSRYSIKWNHSGQGWIPSTTPVPTSYAYAGPGLFDGGKYCNAGLGTYRSHANSKMRDTNRPFFEVNEEQLVKEIYALSSPIDSASPSGSSLSVGQGERLTFKITKPKPATHSLTSYWYLNNVYQSTGDQLTLFTYNMPQGSYNVKVVAVDNTSKVRYDPQQLLREDRSWSVSIGPYNGTWVLPSCIGCLVPLLFDD